MTYRKLRIAWSVICGIAFLLSCVLWARSYWWVDTAATNRFGRAFEFTSLDGTVAASWADIPLGMNPALFTMPEANPFDEPQSVHAGLGFRFSDYSSFRSLVIPYWFTTLLSATLCVAPWLPLKRFSLRTLLIATTLIAVALGLIVWAAG